MASGSSIDPAEFLHQHLAQASPDLLRELMQEFINTLLSADADSVCGACPKHAWGRVNAMLHSVFDQIDAAAVHAQYDRLLDHVVGLPEVHAHLDAAREEILAFTQFPPARGARSGPTTPTSG
jgi:transposase-like protein